MGLPGYMSSHPQTKDRIAAIENQAATTGAETVGAASETAENK